MMVIQNNFLPQELFTALQSYCNLNEFQIITRGDKQFSVLETPKEILPYLQLNGHTVILSFIRSAYKGFDNDLRVHNDGIVEGEQTAMASVLYVNDPKGVSPNATCFWRHEKYGIQAPDGLSNEEFDRLITEDANNLLKWEMVDYVSAIPNRLVTYQSSLFHSKSPKEIERGIRKVLVTFYKKD